MHIDAHEEKELSGNAGGDSGTHTSGQAVAVARDLASPTAILSILPASSAGNINIVVNNSFFMGVGTSITAENNYGSGSGGDISISVGDPASFSGNFGMGPAAVISSRKTAGSGSSGHSGNISISAANIATAATSVITAGRSTLTDYGSAGAVSIYGEIVAIDGEVSSRSAMSDSYCGWYQAPGGGPISIVGDLVVAIDAPAVVSSAGLDPGADLVHIEGFLVSIAGLVELTGDGSSTPNYPATQLGPSNRPGKPANSTGGIEVWGDYVNIDGLNTNGELNADIGVCGGTSGHGWIDVFANGQLTILGPMSGSFAVHANGSLHLNNDSGGTISIKCVSGDILATGLVAEADATTSGSTGGQISVEALTNLVADTAVLSARGDFTASNYSGCNNNNNNNNSNCGGYSCGRCFVSCGGGNNGCYNGYGKGGRIDLTAYTGDLSWTNGIGDVRPTGTGVPSSQRGIITLKYGNTINVPATTVFPAIGNPTTPSTPTHVTSGSPVVPGYVNLHNN